MNCEVFFLKQLLRSFPPKLRCVFVSRQSGGNLAKNKNKSGKLSLEKFRFNCRLAQKCAKDLFADPVTLHRLCQLPRMSHLIWRTQTNHGDRMEWKSINQLITGASVKEAQHSSLRSLVVSRRDLHLGNSHLGSLCC